MSSAIDSMSLSIPLGEVSDLKSPLLSESTQEKRERSQEYLIGRFKWASLLLGFWIGFYTQCSSLGANYLVLVLWGDDEVKLQSMMLLYKRCWALLSSLMLFISLSLLRTLVFAGIDAAVSRNALEAVVDDLLYELDCKFLMGVFVGSCVTWTVTMFVLEG